MASYPPPTGPQLPPPLLVAGPDRGARARSAFSLVVVTIMLGVMLAAVIATVTGAIIVAVQNALNA